uniref:Uncharacterized protein n=1 Tax=Cannabis sativa TaxID=3483 RepID=A0A803PRR2_CANSA
MVKIRRGPSSTHQALHAGSDIQTQGVQGSTRQSWTMKRMNGVTTHVIGMAGRKRRKDSGEREDDRTRMLLDNQIHRHPPPPRSSTVTRGRRRILVPDSSRGHARRSDVIMEPFTYQPSLIAKTTARTRSRKQPALYGTPRPNPRLNNRDPMPPPIDGQLRQVIIEARHRRDTLQSSKKICSNKCKTSMKKVAPAAEEGSPKFHLHESQP